MLPTTPRLPLSYLDSIFGVQDRKLAIRWYMCVIIGLSSLNYADVIPQVYSHLDLNLLTSLSHDERFDAVQKVREGLTKSLGIVGAARTGNALRILANCTPEDLMLKESPRSQESEEKAIIRGNEFFSRVYDKNPLFDMDETERASPDYLFVVKDIIYGRLFSFDGILDDLTSSFAMVSGLYGMNSPGQLRNHMIGMLLNGAEREDLKRLQEILLGLADILGITFRFDPVPIPTIPVRENGDR